MKIINRQRLIYFTATLLLLVAAFLSPLNSSEVSFNARMSLVEPVLVVQGQGLNFPELQPGKSAVVTISSDNKRKAAMVTAIGHEETLVTAAVVENSIFISTGSDLTNNEKITVESWTYGGDLVDSGGYGKSTLNKNEINKLQIGASAYVLAENVGGFYTGKATLRVIYQ